MKALLCCTFLFSSVAAFGQVTCTATTPSPSTARLEGVTELLGDVLVKCIGGTPTPVGSPVPTTNITVNLNTAVTSRLLSDGSSEALLLLDEPGGPSNPNTPHLACIPSRAGGAVPGPGQCNYVLGTGDGAGTYNGSVGRANIYQGTQNGPNSVVFYGVAFDPPGSDKFRILRATNLRGNANQLGAAGAASASITGSMSIGGALAAGSPLTLAVAQPGVQAGAPVPGSFSACNGRSIATLNPDGSTGPTTFSLNFKESFPFAFKAPGSATPSLLGSLSAAIESAFIPSLTAGLPAGVGTADSGTVLQAYFLNIPPGVTITAPSGNLLDANGKIAGTYSTTFLQAGSTSGNGYIVFYHTITARDPANSNIASFTVPFTMSGPSLGFQTPYNFTANIGFANSQYPQSTLFVPGFGTVSSGRAQSTLTSPGISPPNGVPMFDVLGSGVSNPVSTQSSYPASVVGSCVSTPATLTAASTTAPAFINVVGTVAGQNLIAPRVSNVGVGSLGTTAATNVTVAINPPAPWLNVSLSGTTTPLTASLSVNNAAVGNYATSLVFSAPGGLSLTVPVTYAVTNGPWFTRYGFASSASYVGDVVAPGQPFVIFGGNAFGPATLAGPALDANGLAVTSLGGTQVLFDGAPAPLYYSVNANGAGQIAGFAPFELAGKTQTNVQVVYNGVASPPVAINVIDTVPGLYTANSSGGGQGSILNHDLTVNGPGNPEAPGNVIVLYGGGSGQTTPAGRDGGLAGVGAPLGTLTLPVKVLIDNIAATNVQYAGPAPGLVEGVFQINVVIPAGVRHNANVPVVVQIDGNKQSQPGVTLVTK
jgi:uncharacterized protein (TIGR03437 family)